MNIDDLASIKKEKLWGHESTLNKAENLPIPIKIKEEPMKGSKESVVQTQPSEIRRVASYDGEMKETPFQIKKECADNIITTERSVTPPMPVIVKVQPPEQKTDVLSFLDEISDDIDDIIPIEETPITINIDDEDEDIFIQSGTNLGRFEQKHTGNGETKKYDTENNGESKENLKKSNKQSKKRQLSPDNTIDKMKRTCTRAKEISEQGEQFPRKVFNYNHSSLPGILENNEYANQKLPYQLNIKQEVEEKVNLNAELFSKNVGVQLHKIEKVENSPLSELQIDQVLKNCNKALKRLRIFKTDPYFSRFLYTPTKVIITLTDIEQKCRSPLLRNDHVRFKFSSTNSKINYRDFNLISLSENVTRVSNLLGLDVAVLNKWIDNFGKNRYSRIQNLNVDKQLSDHSTFFVSSSTQTTDVPCGECLKRSLHSKRNVAVLAKSEMRDFGTQTIQQGELPVLKMIPYLNANELLALNDFATLLREQNWHTADSSLRLNIRDKLLHYFQEGQKHCQVPGIRTFPPQAKIGVENPVPFANYSITNDLNGASHLIDHCVSNTPYPFQNPGVYPIITANTGFVPHSRTHTGHANDPRLNRNVDVPRYH